MKAWLVPFVAFLIFPSASWLQAQENPCDFQGTVDAYFSADSADIKRQAEQAAIEAKGDTMTAMMGRANDDGLAGGRLDLLRRAFVALDLGTVSEEKGALVFNFNPERLDLKAGGQLSPRVLVHEAALFGPLEKKIDTLSLSEEVRAKAKEDLSNSLQALDDVELRLRWARFMASGSVVEQLDSVAKDLFTPVYKDALQPVTSAFVEKLAALKPAIKAIKGLESEDAGGVKVSTVCSDPEAKVEFLKLSVQWNTQTRTALSKLHSKLSETYFFALADLLEGQPKLVVEGARRRRDGAAGPDETSGSLRFEIGAKSYWAWKNWVEDAKAKAKTDKAETDKEEADKENRELDATSARKFLEGFGGTTLPLFSAKVDWTDISDFEHPLPGNGERFVQEGGRKLSVALQGGMYLGRSRANRLALEAKYVWASADRQDRFVSTLSWTEKPGAELAQLIGGSDVVVSLVWANKPEFRGEVAKELGLRAGLKWSFGGTGE